MPSISIITATYNAAATLSHCLDSVAGQQSAPGFSPLCPHLEHLIIDGGSSDRSLEIARGYPHVSSIISEPDRGIYDAMNKGIALASGEVIGILNADDFYADSRVLERVAAIFADPEVEACYGDLCYVHPENTGRISRYWRAGTFAANKFYQGWMPPHPTFFVRKSVYQRYGLFNLELGSAADYELMLRFLFKQRITVAYIPEVLVYMRAGGASNASLKARFAANRMDRKGWEINGLRPYPWTLVLKPLRKISQWLTTPS